MRYLVKYEDSTGNGTDLCEYESPEAAEAAIEEELDQVKEYFNGMDYDYGDYFTSEGLVTAIEATESGEFSSWTRLWRKPNEEEVWYAIVDYLTFEEETSLEYPFSVKSNEISEVDKDKLIFECNGSIDTETVHAACMKHIGKENK